MTTPMPPLPAANSTNWYAHYQAMDVEARKVALKLNTADQFPFGCAERPMTSGTATRPGIARVWWMTPAAPTNGWAGDIWINSSTGAITMMLANGGGTTPPPEPEPEPTVTIHKWASPTGNDANAGTQAAPYRTIQKLHDNIGPGQVGAIKAGTYSVPYSSGWVLNTGTSNHGTSTSKRRLIGAPGEARPVLRGYFALNTNYTTLEGVLIELAPNLGSENVVIQIGTTSHVTTGFEFHNVIVDGGDSLAQGVLIGQGSSGVPSNNPKFYGCVFRNIRGALQGAGGPGHGIYHQRGSGLIVEGCLFYRIGTASSDPGGRAIQVYPNGTASRISYNTIDECKGGIVIGTESGGTSNNHVFNRNIITGTTHRGAITSTGTTSGNSATNNHLDNNYDDIVSSGTSVSGTTTGPPGYVNRTGRNYTLGSGAAASGKGAYASATPPPAPGTF